MTSRKLRPLAAIAVVSLICAGCSSAPARTTTANSNPTYETAAKFADCMRRNGVAAFPDPAASGELTVDDIANDSSLDTNGAAWKQAIDACKDLAPSGFTGHKRTVQQQVAALAFARCVRDNGVPDFPDPDLDGPLIDTTRMPGNPDGKNVPGLDAAGRKCGATFGDELGLTGQ